MANAEDLSDAFEDTSEAESEEHGSEFGEGEDAVSGASSEEEDASGEDDEVEDRLSRAYAQRRSGTRDDIDDGQTRRSAIPGPSRNRMTPKKASQAVAPSRSSQAHMPQRVSSHTFTSNVSNNTNAALVKIANGVVQYRQAQQGRPLTRAEKGDVMKQVQQLLHNGVRRNLAEPMVLVEYANNVFPPNNELAYVQWAKRYMDDPNLSDTNLPPIMSYIWQPYPRPPSVWSRGWLPDSIDEYNLPHWKLMLMYCLGAGPDEIAARAMTLSPQAPNYKAERSRMKGRFRRRIDDWRKTRGGLVFANAKQETSKIIESILTGTYRNFENNGTDRDYRRALTPLQLHFNCLWDIDPQAGIMVQPNREGADAQVNHRVPYGGRNYSRLFKLAPMPSWVNDQLVALNIALPDRAALKQQHPLLFQDHLCSIDPNINTTYAVGTASASSSPVKNSSPKKTTSSSPSKKKSAIPGPFIDADAQLGGMPPSLTAPTGQAPGVPMNPYGHANKPWIPPNANNYFGAADAYRARMLDPNPWMQTQQMRSSGIGVGNMQQARLGSSMPAFGFNDHNAMTSAPPPWAYPPQHHNSPTSSAHAAFPPRPTYSQQNSGIPDLTGAMTGGSAGIDRSFGIGEIEVSPNMSIDPALLKDFDFNAGGQ